MGLSNWRLFLADDRMGEWLLWSTRARPCHMLFNQPWEHIVVLRNIVFNFNIQFRLWHIVSRCYLHPVKQSLIAIIVVVDVVALTVSVVTTPFAIVNNTFRLFSNSTYQSPYIPSIMSFSFFSVSSFLDLRSLLLASCCYMTFDSIWLDTVFAIPAIRNIHIEERRHTLLYRMTFTLDILRNVNI